MKKNSLFSNVVYFLKYTWKINKKYCLVSIPGIFLTTIEPFILIVFPKLIIDAIVAKKSFGEVVGIIAWMIGLSLFVRFSKNVLQVFSTKENNSMAFGVNADIGSKVMSLKYQAVEDPEVLDLFQKVQKTLNVNGLFSAITNIISNILVLVGLTAIVSRLSFVMVIVIFIIVVINVICDGRGKRYEYKWQTEAAPFNRRFAYMSELMFNFKYGKEVRLNNLNKYFKEKYEDVVDVYSSNLFKIIMRFFKLNSVRTFAGIVQDIFLYLYLAFCTLKGMISIGDFTMFSSAITNLTSSLTSIMGSLLEINQQAKFVGDFRNFMELETLEDSGTRRIEEIVSDGTYVFEFKDVSFKYPNTDFYVLKNVNIKIHKDEKLSIVGLNGAGKTTFVKLLTRLYTPTEGCILLNGVNINEISYSDYMNFFAVVFQDYQLFAFPVQENIILNHAEDKYQISRVLQESGLDEKIKSLPNGEMTEVYKIFSNEGIEFSGGESQKLAIARALYKNSPFIILDEPTAALDPLAEYEIFEKFNTLVQNKTAIYISHRLSSTRLCDNIAVFLEGKIVQYGSHEQLVKEEGIYVDMYEKQAGYYVTA